MQCLWHGYMVLTWRAIVCIWVPVYALHVQQFMEKEQMENYSLNSFCIFKFEQIIKDESKCKWANQKSLYNFNVGVIVELGANQGSQMPTHISVWNIFSLPISLLLSRLLVIFDASQNTDERKKASREQIKFTQTCALST